MSQTASIMVRMGKRTYGTGSIRIKDGAWWGTWRTAEGKRRYRKIGPIRKNNRGPGLTKTEASQQLAEMILAEGHRTVITGPQPTVEQLGRLLHSRLQQQGRKKSHLESVGYHLSAHINPALGDLHPGDVIPRDVQNLIDRMLRHGKAPKTVRNVIGTLHSVLDVARKEGFIQTNPAAGVDLPIVRPSTELRFLTMDEIERVLISPPPEHPDVTQAERDWWPVLRLLIITATMTGMRLGELRALRWQDLDYGAMKVRVSYSYVRGETGSPKSRSSARAIPLSQRVMAELDGHHRSTVWNQDADLVFAHPHTGRELDRVRLLQHFKAALARAEVRPVRLHDLRHTFATTVAAGGQVSMRTLQEWMGHEDGRTTQIYAAYMPDERESQLVDAAFAPRPVVAKSSPIVAKSCTEPPEVMP